ncbi:MULTISPECIES: hypothetical protein [Helicobacter]|uniref:hypothetical protein n=1 Tax=Helicobacter TaxID=209 RepID=UPI001F0AD586|nr:MULTISPECIES: hypothetical protein [Helicobacter]
MKQKYLWGALSLCVLLGACSVYQGADVPTEVKEKAEIKRLKAEQKRHKHDKKAQTSQEEQKPQEPQKPKIDPIKQELAPLQATLAQLSTLVEANAKKMQDLDKQLSQRTPPPKPDESPDVLWESVNPIPSETPKIKSKHFLMGYGLNNTTTSGEEARESAYFNARRMVAFFIYQKFSWALDRKHLKSDNLKSVLLLCIDKAIDTPEIFKEKTFFTLSSYDRVVALFVVDTKVLDRIKELVQLQYTFSSAQRRVIDKLIHSMQSEDSLH